MPIVVVNPASPQAVALRDIAAKLADGIRGMNAGAGGQPQASIDSLLKKIKRPLGT